MTRGWARCQGVACADKQACWRYRAPFVDGETSANYWQTRGERCEFFITMESSHWAILLAPPGAEPSDPATAA